jgi:hypothetical protein
MDIHKALDNLSIENPAIAVLMQQEPSLIGVDAEYFTPFTLSLTAYIGAYFTVVITFLIFVYILYVPRYYKIKKTLSVTARKTFNMLFRVLNIQLLMVGITIVIPCVFVCSVQLLQLKYSSNITTIILVLSSFHHTMDFLCLMYFVTPFRLFIAKKFLEVKQRLLCNARISVISNVNIQVHSQIHNHI